MRQRIANYIVSVCMAVILPFCDVTVAWGAVTLPEGVAAGLPERFTVMDSDGNSADSATGAYFFQVEHMDAGETYTKTMQIMNLREDKAYHIYIYAQPIGQSGEIDLESECEATFWLNGKTIYTGQVDGDGTPNMQDSPIDLGLYEPGESRILTYSVVWNGTDAGGEIDYGARIVDKDGVTVTRDKSGQETISGEVTFRWIFYAVLDESYDSPQTGVLDSVTWMMIGIGAFVFAMILLLLVLIDRKRRRRNAS